jgi:hypothetical protein
MFDILLESFEVVLRKISKKENAILLEDENGKFKIQLLRFYLDKKVLFSTIFKKILINFFEFPSIFALWHYLPLYFHQLWFYFGFVSRKPKKIAEFTFQSFFTHQKQVWIKIFKRETIS